MNASQVGFMALGLLAVIGAAGVVLANNPVRSALCLVLNFFVLGFLYFTLGSPFLGITQIIVYAGAIMVLFLFVIMMLKRHDPLAGPEKSDPRLPVAVVLGLGLFASVFGAVVGPVAGFVPAVMPDYGSPQSIGLSLFSTYVWPFEVISVLLLVGIVGSIMLAKRRF